MPVLIETTSPAAMTDFVTKPVPLTASLRTTWPILDVCEVPHLHQCAAKDFQFTKADQGTKFATIVVVARSSTAFKQQVGRRFHVLCKQRMEYGRQGRQMPSNIIKPVVHLFTSEYTSKYERTLEFMTSESLLATVAAHASTSAHNKNC